MGELTLLSNHEHPTVARMTRSLLAGHYVTYGNEPLCDAKLWLDKTSPITKIRKQLSWTPASKKMVLKTWCSQKMLAYSDGGSFLVRDKRRNVPLNHFKNIQLKEE